MRKLTKQQYYPWLILLACCGISSLMGLTSNAAGIFYMPVAQDFGVGVSSVSLYSTISSIIAGLMGPVIVKMMQRFKLGPMIALMGALGGIAYCSLAMYQDVRLFYLSAVFMGFGLSAVNTLTVNVLIREWFHAATGTVTGIAFAFTGVGGACFSVMFERIISNAGWRTAYLVEGAIIIAVCVVFGLFVVKRRPSEIGLHAFGEGEGESHAVVQKNMGVNHRTGIILIWIFAVVSYMTVSFNSHLSPYAVSVGMDSAFGAYMVSTCMIANIVSKLILGSVSDRIGCIKSVSIFAVVGVLGSMLMFRLGVDAKILALVGAFCMGTQFAINSVGIPIVMRYLVDASKFDRVYATVNLGGLAVFALMITGYGSLFDIFGSYFASNLIVAVLCVAMTALCAFMLMLDAKCAKKQG